MMAEVAEDHPDYAEGLYFAGPNQWPDNLPGFREVVCRYRDEMLRLSQQLLRVFALALRTTPEVLAPLFVDPNYFLRVQHYPPAAPTLTEDQFGLAAHVDASFFTLLAQDEIGGLEIRLDNGEWIKAPYHPNSFIINSGVMLERLSNNHFRAVPHRVLNHSQHERYSIPFFFDPNMHATIAVLESCTKQNHPAQYPPIIYGEYLLNRIQGNYGLGKGTVSEVAKKQL
jgi:isopenicillin N synthase-like dioxygenase